MTPKEILESIKQKIADASHIGAKSLSLPLIVNAKDFRVSKINRPKEIIQGVLTQGARMVLAGPSKSRKSWVLLDLCYSVASGSPWLGIPTSQAKTLYVNFELRSHTIHDRINRISEAREIYNDELLDLWDLRAHVADIEPMVHDILKVIGDREPYGLICLDPTYKLLGDRDENAAGEMTEFCNHLEWLAQDSGAAVVAAAHFPKGAMGARISQDRIAGSGAFARDADAILTMSPHDDSTEDNPYFTIETTLREFKPIKPFVIRWDYPLMSISPDSDPKQITGRDGRPTEYADDSLLKFVPEAGISKSDWKKAAAADTGISQTTFYRRVEEMKKRGQILQDEATGLVKRGNKAGPALKSLVKKVRANAKIGGHHIFGVRNKQEDDVETKE